MRLFEFVQAGESLRPGDRLLLLAGLHKQGQMLAAYLLILAQERCALDHILELAHIAGPIIVEQEILGRQRDRAYLFLELAIVFGKIVLDEQHDVLASLAKGRNMDFELVEPVEEVVAELAFLGELSEVAIGGSQEPDIGR